MLLFLHHIPRSVDEQETETIPEPCNWDWSVGRQLMKRGVVCQTGRYFLTSLAATDH